MYPHNSSLSRLAIAERLNTNTIVHANDTDYII